MLPLFLSQLKIADRYNRKGSLSSFSIFSWTLSETKCSSLSSYKKSEHNMCKLILCSLVHIMWSWCEGECLSCWRNTAAGCGCPNCLSSIATCSGRTCTLVRWSTWRDGKTSAWLVTLCVCLSSGPNGNVVFVFSADLSIELATILFCIWQKMLT